MDPSFLEYRPSFLYQMQLTGDIDVFDLKYRVRFFLWLYDHGAVILCLSDPGGFLLTLYRSYAIFSIST